MTHFRGWFTMLVVALRAIGGAARAMASASRALNCGDVLTHDTALTPRSWARATFGRALRRIAIIGATVAIIGLSGYSTSDQFATASAAYRAAPLHYVVFGDSWIAGQHCGGCTTFAGLWAADLQRETHRRVQITNLSGPNEPSAPQEKTPGTLLDVLRHDRHTDNIVRRADVVLISTGGNDLSLIGDQLINGTCGGTDGGDCIRWLGRLWHRNWDAIVGRIVQLRDGQPTAIRLVSEGNLFLGDADLNALMPPGFATTGGALLAQVDIKAICDAAKKYHAICIDGRPILSGEHFDQPFDDNSPATFLALANALDAMGLPEFTRCHDPQGRRTFR